MQARGRVARAGPSPSELSTEPTQVLQTDKRSGGQAQALFESKACAEFAGVWCRRATFDRREERLAERDACSRVSAESCAERTRTSGVRPERGRTVDAHCRLSCLHSAQ